MSYGSPGIYGFDVSGANFGGYHGVYGADAQVISTGSGAIIRSGNQVGIVPGPSLYGTPMVRTVNYEPTGPGYDRTRPGWADAPSRGITCNYTETKEERKCVYCDKVAIHYKYVDDVEVRIKCLNCYTCNRWNK